MPAQTKDFSSDSALTPSMRQYLEVKKKYPDSILFFRMGDFYELFFDDALIASPILDIALTQRQNRIPMAGFPYHSVDTYLARLLAGGKSVAIAEQIVDPATPKLMKREVCRVISPATIVEESLLLSSSHNFLMALCIDDDTMGVALCDVSTGEFFTLELSLTLNIPLTNENRVKERDSLLRTQIRDIYYRYQPKEILIPSDYKTKIDSLLPDMSKISVPIEKWRTLSGEGVRYIQKIYNRAIRGLGYDNENSPALGAVAMALHYVERSFPNQMVDLACPVHQPLHDRSLILDEQTIRNLDLIQNLQEGGSSRTLISIMDFCRTPMGKRKLREILLQPMTNIHAIRERQNRVTHLITDSTLRNKLSMLLSSVTDLERTLARLSSGRAAPRDPISIKKSIYAVKDIHRAICESRQTYTNSAITQEDVYISDALVELAAYIQDSMLEELPAVLGGGPLFKEGVHEPLDMSRRAKNEGARWIVEFERKEKERTGLSTLKVKYNKVFRYFIEVSKLQAASSVPSHWIRKQTLVGNERYTTDELSELETTIIEAEANIAKYEEEIFRTLVERILNCKQDIRLMVAKIASIDAVFSLASAAVTHRWNLPELLDTKQNQLSIEEGRHPVVEAFLPPDDTFITNSLYMNSDDRSCAILTGPNMAGKSTFIRQIALIQLLAQIGSYVPAKSASLSIVDRIFTRIGASDNLTRGESTFFVEMVETARILNLCKENSLIIMDEVGRGTSTYDGLSIAWAVIEFLTTHKKEPPLVLFATHYHELTILGEQNGIFNLTMDVEESSGKIIFLRKVKEGSADESYGIHVARLAGLPESVIRRATEKLKELEGDLNRRKEELPLISHNRKKKSRTNVQPELFRIQEEEFTDDPETI